MIPWLLSFVRPKRAAVKKLADGLEAGKILHGRRSRCLPEPIPDPPPLPPPGPRPRPAACPECARLSARVKELESALAGEPGPGGSPLAAPGSPV